MRITLALGALALAFSGCIAEQADAKRRYSYAKKSKRAKTGGYSAYGSRGTTAGSCPCNGGDVCIGPRGGRYCITSGGNKRYGV
jgi:hypothetical protein